MIHTKPMHIAFVGFRCLAALDRDQSIDEKTLLAALTSKSVFRLLAIPSHMDSLIPQDVRDELIAAWANIASGGSWRKNYDVDRNGYAILAAFCFELLQDPATATR